MTIHQKINIEPEIDILINTRDRHAELSLLLQSIRTQTYKKWNLFILDESQTPLEFSEFLSMVINLIKKEGHGVIIERNITPLGVCNARNKIVELALKRNLGSLYLRIDDDCILEPDYIEQLLKRIEYGYDIVSGVTPSLRIPDLIRQTKFVKPFINRIDFDKEGNITHNGDDCGVQFSEQELIPAHHFRSCALIRKEVHEKVSYPTNLTPVGFREESFFSIEAILKDYTICVMTGAVAHHFQSSSGGCRYDDYAEKVATDNVTFNEWVKKLYKEKGDFLPR